MTTALSVLRTGDQDFGEALKILSEFALLKHSHTGCSHCLDEAVKFGSDALSAVQKRYHKSEAADYLLTLAYAYKTKFDKYRMTTDLEQAIAYSKLGQETNDRKWREGDFKLQWVAIQLSKAMEPLDLPGIETDIESLRKSVRCLEKRGAPAHVRAYHQLSLALRKKYEAGGRHADLDESRNWAIKAVEIMVEPDICNGMVANNLARVNLLYAKSPDGMLRHFRVAASLSCLSIERTSHDNVAQFEYLTTLTEVLEEGRKCGQFVLEKMEEAADEGTLLSFDLLIRCSVQS